MNDLICRLINQLEKKEKQLQKLRMHELDLEHDVEIITEVIRVLDKDILTDDGIIEELPIEMIDDGK